MTPPAPRGASKFETDAEEILSRPRDFGTWQWGTADNGARQLERLVLDKYQRVVRVCIQAGARYPAAPPNVVTSPPVQDQCFSPSSGELRWARAAESGQLVWSEYAASSNPLAILLDELRRKYHVF